MKILIKHKAIFIILWLIFSVGFIACQKNNHKEVERKVAKKIAEYIIEKDSIKLNRYSDDVFLHISSRKLNENNFKSFVSLNGLRSKSSEFQIEELTIKGYTAIVYYSKENGDFNLADPFFVPDSESWNFLSELYDDQIVLNQMKRIHSNEKSEIDIPDEFYF